MAERPYTVLSCGVSLDGYLDVAGPERLVLSNDADLARVDAVRAASDAILVGAATVRHDDPRLLVRDPRLRADRVRRGLPESPVKVTLTASGDLDPRSRFFTTGHGDRLVYAATGARARGRRPGGSGGAVVAAGGPGDVGRVAEDLHARGVRTLMVEGGGRVLTQFLTGDLVDELQLVVAPFFVGDPRAHRYAGPGRYPWHPERRAHLLETRQLGDVVLLRYALSARCRHVHDAVLGGAGALDGPGPGAGGGR